MREPVHLNGASLKGLYVSVLLCSYAGGCADELKCESLYVCTVRAHKDFVRCEPTRASYNVLVLAHQGFVQCASVLVRERVQINSCARACTSVRCEPTRALCFCAGGCADELMCESLYVCTVRAHKGFMQCASS